MSDQAHFPKWLIYYREEESRQLNCSVCIICGDHILSKWIDCRMSVGHIEPTSLTYRPQLL